MSAGEHETVKAATAEPAAPVHPADTELAAVARLKEQAVVDLRRQKQLGIAALAALGAFLVLVYFPSVTTLAQLKEQIVSDARQLQTDRERSRMLPEMRLTAARLERDLTGFKPFPSQPPLDELISETTQLGMQFQLRDLRCEPAQEVVDGPLGILPVRLTFEGNFENVYSFVRRCEQMPRPVRVQELRIKQKPAGAGNAVPPAGDVTVELKLNVYFEA